MTAIDIDYLQGWIGRERVRQDALSVFPVQALAATLDRQQSPQAGDSLPPTWQWLYFNEAARRSELGADGHPQTGGFLPPVPLPRRMWASGEFFCEHPLRIGVPAEQRSRVSSVELKQGASGTLVFVTLEHRTTQDGHSCLFEKQHLVYREMPSGPSPSPAGEAPAQTAEFQMVLQPDPVLLMRYSALTFNGHRIHYDRDYAVGREHYPGLVVQGPLLATLLAEHLNNQCPGEAVGNFRFRALRPVFDADSLRLCGRRTDNAVALWIVNQDGFVTTTASATLGALP